MALIFTQTSLLLVITGAPTAVQLFGEARLVDTCNTKLPQVTGQQITIFVPVAEIVSSGRVAVPSTVTVKQQVLVFPCESVALAVTDESPKGKGEPDGGEKTTGRLPSQLSVAVAE